MDKQTKEEISDCILGVKKRDNESLNKLYHLIGHTIKYISLKYLKNEDDALDLEQDFWADIYTISDKYIYILNGFSYLCIVMTRMAINRYRKLHGEKLRVVHVVDYNELHHFDENETIDSIDTRISVQSALNKLDETSQKIMQLQIFEKRTIVQIAEELKISKSTVGRKKLAAEEKLMQELDDNMGNM